MTSFQPYFRYLRPHLGVFLLSLLCALVYGLASGFGIAWMLQRVLPSLFDPAAARLAGWQLAGLAALIPLAFLVRGLSGFFNTYLINWVGLEVLRRLREDLFAQIQRLQLSWFRRHASGELLSRLTADATLVQQILTTVANDIIKQPATLLFAFGYLIYTSITNRETIFVLASVAVVPLCVLPVRWVGSRLLKRAREQQEQVGDLTGLLAENLGGAREIRAFNLERHQEEKLRAGLAGLLRTQMRVVRYQNLLGPLIEIITSLGVALAFVFAYRKGVSLQAFVTLMPVLYFSYDAIKRIGNLHNQIQHGSAALQRIEEIFREPITVLDPPNPVPLTVPRGEVVFDHVSFAYDREPVLHDIYLQVAPRTTVALVGPSGAGKSTLISLLPRFFDPSSGAIRLDGTDLRACSQADLRRHLALVPQDPFLFRDTLFHNILLGRPGATPAEVEAAARDAFIHDFIVSLPQGYQTLAGERGSQLSGGQRQRIALARAFLRDAPILILDEATSALDSESEQRIQDALRRLVRDRTVFIVAHRFSTIRQADRILLLESGRLAADGSLDQLLAHPTFRKLYENQTLA